MSAKKARRLYEAFRETKPKRTRAVRVKLPKAVFVMGYLSAVEYETTHGSKAVGYRHKFAPGSRPLLCAGPGKNELFIIGGRYHVTDRGIVDLSASGREIEDGGGHT